MLDLKKEKDAAERGYISSFSYSLKVPLIDASKATVRQERIRLSARRRKISSSTTPELLLVVQRNRSVFTSLLRIR